MPKLSIIKEWNIAKIKKSVWEFFTREFFDNQKKFRNTITALWIVCWWVAIGSSEVLNSHLRGELMNHEIQDIYNTTRLAISNMNLKHSKETLKNEILNIGKYLYKWKVEFTTSSKNLNYPINNIDINNRVFLENSSNSWSEYLFDYGVKRPDKNCLKCHDTNLWIISYKIDLSEGLDSIWNMSKIFWSLVFSTLFFLWFYWVKNKERERIKKAHLKKLTENKKKREDQLKIMQTLNSDLQKQQEIILQKNQSIEIKMNELKRLKEFFLLAPMSMFRLADTKYWFQMFESNKATLNMPTEFHLLIAQIWIKNDTNLKSIFPEGIEKDEFIKNKEVKTSNIYIWWKVFSVLAIWDPKMNCINFYLSDITELDRLKWLPMNNINPLYYLDFDGEDDLFALTVNDASKEALEIINKTTTIEKLILQRMPREKIKALIWTRNVSEKFELKIWNSTYKWFLKWAWPNKVLYFFSNNIDEEIRMFAGILSSEEEEEKRIKEISIPWLDITFHHKSLDRWSKYWWDFLFFIPSFQKWVLKFMIWDAAWKWLEAALIVDSIRKIIFENKDVTLASSPDHVLRIINKHIKTSIQCIYATWLCVFIDFNTWNLSISNAGHDSPIYFSENDDWIERNVEKSGFALWMFKKWIKWFNYWNSSLSKKDTIDNKWNKFNKLKVGGKIIFFTDWLTEATNSQWIFFNQQVSNNPEIYKKVFSENKNLSTQECENILANQWVFMLPSRLDQIVLENKHLPVKDLKKKILEGIHIWTWGKWVHDDIIIFILEITPEFKPIKIKDCGGKLKKTILDLLPDLSLDPSQAYDAIQLLFAQEQAITLQKKGEVDALNILKNQASQTRVIEQIFWKTMQDQAELIKKELSGTMKWKEDDMKSIARNILEKTMQDQLKLAERMLAKSTTDSNTTNQEKLAYEIIKKIKIIYESKLEKVIEIVFPANKKEVKPLVRGKPNNLHTTANKKGTHSFWNQSPKWQTIPKISPTKIPFKHKIHLNTKHKW